MIYKTTQNEYVLLMTQDQNWSIKKIGLTWCCKDLIQVMQDIEFCKARYPNAICKPIALQFLTENDVAILELSVDESNNIYNLSVIDERHYKLVGRGEITENEIRKLSLEE
jgi:hypothetical protein